MNFTKVRILFSLIFLFYYAKVNAQNIGINSTGNTPNASAMLDVESSDKGILIPRIALTQTTSNAPIGASVTTSLLIYNTATINDVTPGFYFWNGTSWDKLGLDNDSWKIDGNSNTSIGTNFFGTINNTGIAFKTDNTERMRLQSNGQLTIGHTTAGAKLDVHQTTNTAVGRFTTYGNTNDIELRRTSGTIGAPTATTVSGTVLGRFLAQGYDGSGFTSAASILMELDATGGTNTDMPGRIVFSTTPDGSGTLAERMRITNDGRIGIGTTSLLAGYMVDVRNTAVIPHGFNIEMASHTVQSIGIDVYHVNGTGGAGTKIGVRSTTTDNNVVSKIAIKGAASGSAGTKYGADLSAMGTGLNNYGVYAHARQATNNYGGYFIADLTGVNTGIYATANTNTNDNAAHFNGTILLNQQSFTPTQTAAVGETKTYVKNTGAVVYYVIQYNDGGTMKYRYLTLTSTDATWTYSLVAP